jgi:hypothetical protein
MSEMHDILNRLQQLNESAQPVTEGKMKELLGDIDELTSDEFSDKYSMSKAEAKAKFNLEDEEVNEVNEGADGKMPSKKHVMDMCKDGKSEKEMLEMHADADKDKLKDLIKTCKEEMKDSKQSAIAEGVARIEEKLLKEFTEFKEGKAFAASGVRADKRGKYNTAPQTFYHVKLEKDNVTKAERILASDGDSESDVKSNAKRDNPGWKVVSVRKLDETAKQKAKPDYIDLDGDGDKKEPMKKAAKDKKAKENK